METESLHWLSPSSKPIIVSPEAFEWLLAELDRPAKANPKMVELLRDARRVVRQR